MAAVLLHVSMHFNEKIIDANAILPFFKTEVSTPKTDSKETYDKIPCKGISPLTTILLVFLRKDAIHS